MGRLFHELWWRYVLVQQKAQIMVSIVLLEYVKAGVRKRRIGCWVEISDGGKARSKSIEVSGCLIQGKGLFQNGF